eukprot:CAMPEP_0172908780 /NCGR_PEP_ID=MMETSP1075-20121228/181428_1 /TAXON_ID=2916 /ORGANISM="Ceratium fusus, Strain PA161109" /LENGTH=406 /DNA_ID=CAMNT_0013766615 /DNA_START=5 /DNA_END=1225 /DNA_ORIENTATION=-
MAQTQVHVAILGGGVGGSAAASSLLRDSGDKVKVTLIEMGRGLGGRACTRGTREDARIAVNHGAPFADVATQQGLAIFQDLQRHGFATEFAGEVRTLKLEPESGAKTFEESCAATNTSRWGGMPTMSRLAEGLLARAPRQPEYVHGRMVRKLEPVVSSDAVAGWRLLDKDGELVSECDWLLVAGSGVAHPRWTASFGGVAPLVAAAEPLQDETLNAAVATVGAMGFRPVQVAMMTFEGEVAAAWRKLPFRVAEVHGDAVLGKVAIQEGSDDVVSVVLHSTHSFAEDSVDVYGATGTAARVAGVANDRGREQQVLGELVTSMKRALVGDNFLDASHVDSAAAIFGPHLHRWGAAFPSGVPLSLEQAVCTKARVAFCGDYVGDDALMGSIEGAILSGTAIGERIAARL